MVDNSFQDDAKKTQENGPQKPPTLHKARPHSNNTQSITIRSYLGRFLAQSKPSIGLNPIVTSAVTTDKPSNTQPVKIPQSQSSQSIDKRNVLPFGVNYSALHRPKLNSRNPTGATRTFHGSSVIEQEIRALARLENDSGNLDKFERLEKHLQNTGSIVLNSRHLEQRMSNPEILSPPYGPILPSQTYSNLNRYCKPDQSVGLSIISTPAPVQYKEDIQTKTAIGSIGSGPLEINGICR